jgi:hypothetical protein
MQLFAATPQHLFAAASQQKDKPHCSASLKIKKGLKTILKGKL